MSKHIFLTFTAIGIALSQFGCSTASVRVMPGANGEHRVITRDIEKEGAEEAGFKAANKFCKENNQQAVFLEEKTQYTGTMDESTRQTMRMGGKAAQAAGHVAGGLKGNRNKDRDREIKKLERDKWMLKSGLNSYDPSRKEAAQRKEAQIDAEIARLRAGKEQSGSLEDVAVVGGTAAQVYTSSKDYQNEIKFRCQ